MSFCGCDSIQNCLEHDKQPDKPLFYQGKWWLIGHTRDYFFYKNHPIIYYFYLRPNIYFGHTLEIHDLDEKSITYES